MNSPQVFVAAKVFIERNGNVLVVRESGKYGEGTRTGEWDVPGGRIKPGETLREVAEETGLSIALKEPFFANEAVPRPDVNGEEWQIVRIFFRAVSENGDVMLSGDHDEYKWIDPKNFRQESVIENLFPAFEKYIVETT